MTTDLTTTKQAIGQLGLTGPDPAAPSAARVCDHLRGGGRNFPADRDLAARLLSATPCLRTFAWSSRRWLRRVVAGAVVDGISQILDIGCGIATDGCSHDIAHAIDPTCRIVYVDQDPIAVAATRMVLDGQPIAGTQRPVRPVENARVVQARIQDVNAVLGSVPEFDPNRRTLVVLDGVMHFVPDSDNPLEVIRAYRDAFAPGSVLALSHLTDDAVHHGVAAGVALWDRGPDRPVPRTYRQVREMLEAWGELVSAGPAMPSASASGEKLSVEAEPRPEVVYLPRWRPDDPGDPAAVDPSSALAWGGAARKLGPRRLT
jgi:SAM-dependent methyltransferase